MNKKYIKLNNNQNHLSLGNFCRIIKENSLNKTYANQSNIFCTILNIETISESTINNYCIGCRSIGANYKELYHNYKHNYQKNKNYMLDIILNLLSILNGYIYTEEYKKLFFINNDQNLIKTVKKLYNITKNDKTIPNTFINQLNNLVTNNNYYEAITEILFYIILEKKQPIYIENIINETIENILINTNISINDLENFLNLHFKDGINYIYSLKKLSSENNPYACFELGLMEYLGQITGTPRFNKAYEYLQIASSYNHPRANYLIGKMLLNKNIGTLSPQDIELALKYLKNAESLGNIASLNALGLYYLNIKKNEKKAIDYFKKASKHDYVYAFNNLGLIEERKNNYKEAFYYYEKSANLNESWACNKLGELYRLGIGTQKNLKKAFYYYNQSINVPISLINYHAKYNLAKYFYLNGNYEANVEKNESLALEYLNDASNNNIIEASIELLYYYTNNYQLDKINHYINLIEQHPKYNSNIKQTIEATLKKTNEKEPINKNILKVRTNF